MPDPKFEGARPLRILTIDNGGLQAICILRMLKDICVAISAADGYPEWRAPHELFDIIAGIGTGGWLAILLGRYKLSLDQCMGVYLNIASAVGPKHRRFFNARASGDAAAISQGTLMEKIDELVAEHELGECLISEEVLPGEQSHACYAFAIGVEKRAATEAQQQYHLFRTYSNTNQSPLYSGPDPRTCKVSRACAATGAARDFMQHCEIDGMTYWDDRFPETHNVSCIALNEAQALFGKGRPLGVIINLSPGLPTPDEVKTLRKTAGRQASTAQRMSAPLRRMWSAISADQLAQEPQTTFTRVGSWPLSATSWNRVKTTSCAAKETELEHQKVIRDRLKQDYGQEDVYIRLAMTMQGVKKSPYLSDTDDSEGSMASTVQFLTTSDAQKTIQRVKELCTLPLQIRGDGDYLMPEPTKSPVPSNRSQISVA